MLDANDGHALVDERKSTDCTLHFVIIGLSYDDDSYLQSSITELGETTVCVSEESLLCDMEPTSLFGAKEEKCSSANNNEADEVDSTVHVMETNSLQPDTQIDNASAVGFVEGRYESGHEFSWFGTFSVPKIIVVALVVTAGFIILRQFRRS